MRAQQTIAIIMKMLNIKKPIYISPCSHEINFGSNNCDSTILEILPVASNIPTCINNSGTCGKLSVFSDPNTLDNYEVNLNWDYYMEFNNNNDNFGWHISKYQNTDMVNEIINLYNRRL
jgi:hypothetical protein